MVWPTGCPVGVQTRTELTCLHYNLLDGIESRSRMITANGKLMCVKLMQNELALPSVLLSCCIGRYFVSLYTNHTHKLLELIIANVITYIVVLFRQQGTQTNPINHYEPLFVIRYLHGIVSTHSCSWPASNLMWNTITTTCNGAGRLIRFIGLDSMFCLV